MDQKIYHGSITPSDVASVLNSQFNRGAFKVLQQGTSDQMAVQIANTHSPTGGETALTVLIQTVEDGIAVKVGQQALFGVAASIGFSIFSTLRNPWNLLGRLDDLATDIESLNLTQQVWDTIDAYTRSVGAGQELSERLRRLECDYCKSANPVGESNCLACGAPLGGNQPRTCQKCGYVFKPGENFCPNCGSSAYPV
jgi:hypothetical protein